MRGKPLSLAAIVVVSLLVGVLLVRAEGSRADGTSDVVVYGGTPAGVAAALGAARHDADVALVVAGTTVGGMMSNGISASDVGSPLAVQGVASQFFEGVRAHYGDPRTWRFEPHVAERVMRRMLDEAGVSVRFRSPLSSVRVSGSDIECLSVAGGDEVCADSFIDASYTGDLIGEAGIPHRIGLSDLHAYGETLPKLRDWVEVLSVDPEEESAAQAAFAATPFVQTPDSIADYSEAFEDGTPSLAYRLCITDDPDNRTAFRPSTRYEELVPSFRLVARALGSDIETKSNGTSISDIFHLAVIPGGKYDLNSGRLGPTNVPAPADYFVDPAVRSAFDRSLREYAESFYYFLGRDVAVPAELREAFAPFGLCSDEFVDNGHWPREPYVREGRRIEGRYTLTEADIYTVREKATAVAIGSYDVDLKPSQFLFADGRLVSDGIMMYTAPAYEIPYEAMLPAEGSVTNLLAPIGVSSSPTAYGSVRMEPQYMGLGEAAGIAAALAARTGTTVSGVSVSAVQQLLREGGVVFALGDLCRMTPGEWRRPGGYTADCDVVPVQPSAF